MKIEVDTGQLSEKSNEIKLLNNQLNTVMEEIEILILSITGEWQGKAERSFSEKILYVKQQFKNISVFFEDYSALLKKFAETYETQEADISFKINQV